MRLAIIDLSEARLVDNPKRVWHKFLDSVTVNQNKLLKTLNPFVDFNNGFTFTGYVLDPTTFRYCNETKAYSLDGYSEYLNATVNLGFSLEIPMQFTICEEQDKSEFAHDENKVFCRGEIKRYKPNFIDIDPLLSLVK